MYAALATSPAAGVDAARFAARAHHRQRDRAGRPFVDHLHQVAAVAYSLTRPCPALTSAERDEVSQVAWLYATIDRTDTTAGELRDAGFSHRVVPWVLNLSQPGRPVDYADWITCLALFADLPVLLVKIAALTVEGAPEHAAALPEPVRTRQAAALRELRAAAQAKGLRA